MRLSVYTNEKSHIAIPRDLNLDDLVKVLCTFSTRPVKGGPAWSPATLSPCPSPCVNTGTTRAHCAGGELHRREGAVLSHSLVVFDLDHILESSAQALLSRLADTGLHLIAHSTFSHNPPDDCGLRLVLFPDRDILAVEVKQVRETLQRVLALPSDPATKDLSRIYFLPTRREGGPDTFALHVPGAPFSVDELLATPAPSSQERAVAAPVDINALRDRLRTIPAKKPESKALARTILDGAPLAPLGEHDTTLQRLAGLCATWLPEQTPYEAVLHLCETSLRKMEWQDGWDHLVAAFQDKYERAMERTIEYRAECAAELATLQSAIRKRVAEHTLDPIAAETAEDGKYTANALEQWKIQDNEWVIQKNDTYFVFVNGEYIARSKSELPNCIHRDLLRSPVDLEPDADKELNPGEIVRVYGSVARIIEADLALQRSYFDPQTGVFHEAVCPLRRLEPKHDPDIQRWLELLGGKDKDRLLDWVATVTDLRYQTCAVYFHGDSGTGKSLFAHGLKRLWTTGAPTTLKEAFGDFNEAMTKCPLVFADERLPDRRTISEDLRELIGSSSRQLNRKFMASASLVGACRLIVAGNSKDLIRPSNDMTAFDLKAVSDRILFLEPGPETGKLLDQLGGRPVVNEWVTSDLLACHALWLRDNRQVPKNTNRFLVMGQHNAFHDRLAVNSGVAKQVCEVLVKHLAAQMPNSTVQDTLLYGCGELLVNVNAIELLWDRHIKTNDKFPMERMAKALAAISHGSQKIMVKGRTRRYARVRIEQLCAWAEENGVADPDELRARINEPSEQMNEILGRRRKEAA